KFQVPMDEAPRRFEEGLGDIKKAWGCTEPFDHEGEFWRFKDMTAFPKPVQQPHPAIWIAASSPDSMDRVARNDCNLLISQGETFQRVAEQISYYRGAMEKEGRRFSPSRVVTAR